MEIRVPTIERAKDLQNNLTFVASKTRQAILAGNQPGRREEALKLCDKAWENVEKDAVDLEKLSPRWKVQENRDRLARIREQIPNYKRVADEAIAISGSRSADATVKGGDLFSDKAVINDSIKQSLGDLVESQLKLLNEEKEQIASANSSLFLTIGITSFAALAIGILVALYLSRKISVATAAVLQQAEAIAAGDLTGEEVKVVSEDELGDLTRAVNKMHLNLREVIQSIAENAQNVANASEEFSAVSQQIGANSEETSA
jgi:methyl-accepting chemotaxis protein